METDYAALEKAVNLPELLSRVEGDRELLADLLDMFQTELPGHRETLRRAIGAGDQAETARAAHALKGMLANLSMEKGASLAAAVEIAARNADIQMIEKTFAGLELETESLSAAVQEFLAGK